MWPKEAEGFEKLLEERGCKAPDGPIGSEDELSPQEKAYLKKSISISRAHPDEKGPLVVEIDGESWVIDKGGRVKPKGNAP